MDDDQLLKMGILIVDDSEDMRRLYESIFLKAGFNSLFIVDSATGAYKILGITDPGEPVDSGKLIKGNPSVDLILMDVAMPEIDGIEACVEIRKYPKFQDIPIIMLTAMDDEKLLELSLDSGAIEYITKPPKKLELLARVRAILRLKREINARKVHEDKLRSMALKLSEQNKLLKKLAITDSLTGLANRRYFFSRLNDELKMARRCKIPLSLIMIDVDNFKQLNDTYGHQAGDRCLKQLAKTILPCLRRPGDLAARYGGEELVIIAMDSDIEGARGLAESIRDKIDKVDFVNVGSVTCSFGVTEFREDDAAEMMIKRADDALYKAKSDGKNRVVSL